MKKILLTVLSAVVLLGVSVLSVDHYQKYQNKQTQNEQAAAAQKVDELTALKNADNKQYSELVGQFNALRVECEKGKAAYDTLTPVQKAKTAAPVCGAVLAQ